MLETDELLIPEEEGSRKWRLKSLILEGEMSSATNLGRRFGPRSVFWRSLGHGVLLCINDSLQCLSFYWHALRCLAIDDCPSVLACEPCEGRSAMGRQSKSSQ